MTVQVIIKDVQSKKEKENKEEGKQEIIFKKKRRIWQIKKYGRRAKQNRRKQGRGGWKNDFKKKIDSTTMLTVGLPQRKKKTIRIWQLKKLS